MTSRLDLIRSPRDLDGLSVAELELLAAEIRDRLCEVVNLNGGHLASNLGVVELTIALHRVFDFTVDRVVWDVSHQTYTHKILTGRNELFARLRQYAGCCGFNSKAESPYDFFDAGHAGTSLSSGLGIAVGRSAQQLPGRTVVVVGDASIASGMLFEAMNHTGDRQQDILVVLNDNRMSIDHSVGGLSKYLNRLRSGQLYRGLKRDVQVVLPRIPLVGRPFEEALEHLHEMVHSAFVPGQIFEDIGFRYFGPMDGHDLPELIDTFQNMKTMRGPVLFHVVTNKGHGFPPAQEDPIKYHASKGFLPSRHPKEPPTIKPVASPRTRTYSDAFGEAMVRLGEDDPAVHAITAAMPHGTGLSGFQRRFPDRYYDVGIAEQHGTAFASGLGFEGLKPVFAVYSTFLQRAYDQVVHDVALQQNPVVFCLDRAGLVEDGPTHHGVFDIAFLRTVPGISLAAPGDGEDLEEMLRLAVDRPTSSAIRYSKTPIAELDRPRPRQPVEWGRAEVILEPREITVLAYGAMVQSALEAATELQSRHGLEIGVVNMRFAKPIDVELLREIASEDRRFITLEEHAVRGGFGSAILETFHEHELPFRTIATWGIPDEFISFGSRDLLLRDLSLDRAGIVSRIRSLAGYPRTQSLPTSGTAATGE
ncbi:MAG: 1-deoxy-D-xylulose-5-phosphate synthase [Planctomycetes bacterium]|nr:1-deoxy-D-xylulose-5-phosphate synthase [Planctomycetota bacterium]